jgi:23S rRNA (guanosine2251-2'-O)-methyltransferase
VKQFRQQKPRPKKNTLVVGRTAVLEALKTGVYLDKIYLQQNVGGDAVQEIIALASQNAVPVSKVPVEKINYLNVFNHEGCVAQLARVQYQNLQDVVSQITDNGGVPFLLMLDGITDIRNIGAIARSAYAMGVHAIIIPEKGVGALNEDAILTSAGALEQIAICRVNSLMKAVDELHLNGILTFASEMKASKNLSDIDFSIPCAIVMGNEEKGIYQPLLKLCDEQFKIPMPGNFESLNVSVATGIILYEVVKQRMA